jgi:hypothetical protein
MKLIDMRIFLRYIIFSSFYLLINHNIMRHRLIPTVNFRQGLFKFGCFRREWSLRIGLLLLLIEQFLIKSLTWSIHLDKHIWGLWLLNWTALIN